MTEAALATSIRTYASSLRHCAARRARPSGHRGSSPKNRGLEGNRFADGVLAHARVQGFAPNDRRITTSKEECGPRHEQANDHAHARATPTTRATWPPGWLPVRPGLGVSRLTVGWLQTRRGTPAEPMSPGRVWSRCCVGIPPRSRYRWTRPQQGKFQVRIGVPEVDVPSSAPKGTEHGGAR